jgi:hypothetical protein
MDVNTGKITEIWDGQFSDYKVDPTGNWVVVNSLSSAVYPNEELPGYVYGSLQLINLRSLERVQHPISSLGFPEQFLPTNDGLVVPLPNSGIYASLDIKYWVEVLYSGNIKVYAQDLTLVREISISFPDTSSNDDRWPDIYWTPDSSGLFLIYGRFKHSLYFVNVLRGDVNLVDFPVSNGRWINDNQ